MNPRTILSCISGLTLSLVVAGTSAAGVTSWNTNEEGVVLDGYDVVVYFNEDRAIKGRSDLNAKHDGVRFHFSSRENLAAFQENPGKYTPKFVAAFHVVAQGECWLRRAASVAIRVGPGDIVLLPHGTAHELVHEAGADARPADELLNRLRDKSGGPRDADSTGSVTTLVCGHFEYDHRALHPFFETLPDLVHVSAKQEELASWLVTASRLAAEESTSQQRGASVVVDRLAEALLVQTLRLFLENSSEPRGFLAAIHDASIGRALSSLHGDPSKDWSLAELARKAGLSRSAFTERFRELVGESPMRYLARWRMLTARELLREGSVTMVEVASRVGYRSEFAFAKAFKRYFGRGPGAIRRSA